MNAIEIKNLSKHFGTCHAVNNVSFQVREGELFTLLGVNGAGKTTLMRMACGLSRPDGGMIDLMGQGIDATKALFNISPQETAVAKNLTVRENLVLMAKFYGLKRDEAQRRAQEIMTKLSLEGIAHRRAKVLSGGWQRRLSIAMALINSPKILFLDEPTLGLDVLARRSLWRVIEDLRNHVTIVLTTHYMEEAEALSDRIGIMQQGRLIRLGTLDELKGKTHTNSLEQAFVAIVEKEASHALS
ncbi:MAG: ABC transporter ATP-binding protein [Bacillota bacterium]|nr:ABC transporter ATP-binding protein [Bacillota bacterium]